MADRQRPFAKRSLGQNFLTDHTIIERIVKAVDLSKDDTVIEIGPGRGALTERLVDSGANVIAIELDRELVPLLVKKFSDYSNFAVTEVNALEIDFQTLKGANWPPADTSGSDRKVVANLPYYISTAILQRLAEQRMWFSSLVLMFQREVVKRITAEPGESDRGFLTVIVEAAFSVERLFDVPPTAFAPVPKVWSSVVRLTPKSEKIDDEPHFRQLVSDAFGQKRKTIHNNLKENYPNASQALDACKIDPKRRAETLSLAEWIALHDVLRRN